MLEFLLLVILIQATIFGMFCAFIATQKNRNAIGWFFTGFFFSFLALLALIAIPTKKDENQKPLITENYGLSQPRALRAGEFQGEKVLASSKYQIFLVKKYEIERNSTLEKYIFENDLFDNLEAALKMADERYQRDLQKTVMKEDELRELEQSISSNTKIVKDRILIFVLVCVGVGILVSKCNGY